MNKRILYISQEIAPFSEESTIATASRLIPQAIQERGYEIRVFMPDYGNINERRNQLHEVIRLSGLNLIIDDNDHSLIIKVASIQPARIQVYFIDNEDFFDNKGIFTDNQGKEYDNNDERSIFFVRGVMETIKKLHWIPDIVHCHGWFSALAPIYVKKGYKDDPCFIDSKVILSLYDDTFEKSFGNNFFDRLRFEGINDKEIEKVKTFGEINYVNLMKMAIAYSDGIVQGCEKVNPELSEYVRKSGKPFITYTDNFDSQIEAITQLYEEIEKK